jgi:23S rRNA (cytosine1962-C5)-methyltransferase
VTAKVRLRKKLERVIREGHPWVWRDALDGEAAPGEVVTIVDRRGKLLARGIADAGPIGVRVWTTRDEVVDAGLIARRLALAAALRDAVVPAETDCYRLVNGEGDRMPGVVCDVYGAYGVLRFDGEGIERWRDTVVAALGPVLAARGVETLLLRSGRQEKRSVSLLYGSAPGGPVLVHEHGMMLPADVLAGQKTGMFLDHRESRRRVRELSRSRRVLNLYGYTGGFSVAAGLGGARAVTTVDVAPKAIELAREAWRANGLPEDAHEAHAADVPAFLGEADASKRSWDLVVSDPPSFAPRESAVGEALESYTKLHAACVRLLSAGGILLAASCSSHVRRETFEKTLLDGARKAGKILQVLERHGAPADHPRLLAFPEGDYLKVVVARVAE